MKLLEIQQPSTACCDSIAAAVPLSADVAERTARRFRALADPTRVLLISIIAAQPGREACVCNLTDPVGLSQPTVSHHLRILTDAGLITREQRGKWAFYTLVPQAMNDLAATLTTTH